MKDKIQTMHDIYMNCEIKLTFMQEKYNLGISLQQLASV